MSIFWDVLYANLIAGMLNSIFFWSFPIILFLVLKRIFKKQWKKIERIVRKIGVIK